LDIVSALMLLQNICPERKSGVSTGSTPGVSPAGFAWSKAEGTLDDAPDNLP
jgi:hypothetical protein